METERERFETWAISRWMMHRHEDGPDEGEYVSRRAQAAWENWQAAWKAARSDTAPTATPFDGHVYVESLPCCPDCHAEMVKRETYNGGVHWKCKCR